MPRPFKMPFCPKLEDLHTSFADTFLIYKPKDIVSGDFYWHTQTDDHTQFIAVADCTGHGVPGAFMSMIGNTLLHEIININDIHEPATILEELDQRIHSALRQKESHNNDGMDIAICKITHELQGAISLQFAGAKRAIYWYSQGDKMLKKISSTRRGIGGWRLKSKPFEQTNLILGNGDIIYLHTDGLADQAMIKNGKKIGSPFIFNLIKDHAHLPLINQKETVLHTLKELQGEAPQRDDITLVAFQI